MLKGKPAYKATNSAGRKGARILEEIYPVATGQSRESVSVRTEMALDELRIAAHIVVDDPSAAPMELGNARIKNPPKPFSQMLAVMRAT